MSPNQVRAEVVAAGIAVAACACHSSSPGTQATTSPTIPSAAPAAVIPPRASAAPAPSIPSPPPDPVADALTSFFAGYKDGTDFAFLNDACEPKLERFLTLKNVDVATVIKSARGFFRDKDSVAYKPMIGAKKVEVRPDGSVVVRLPVQMIWRYPLPAELKTDQTPAVDDASPEVHRDVTVDVEIGLDASRKISRYVETHVRTPALRVTGQDNCWDGAGQDPMKGVIVYDLGETFMSADRPRGPDYERHVHAPDGDTWLMDSVSFEVAAGSEETCKGAPSREEYQQCMMASAAGGSQCLERLVTVGDGGK
jgi:hypothetical protein